MAHDLTGKTQPDDRLAYRCARAFARYGAPGAVLAFLILRAAALAPLTMAHLKAVKLLPVLLFCCYELTWLFGWIGGALIIAQYVVHEWGHVSAARAHGRLPGWYGLIPIAGPYMSAGRAAWISRETEAYVALQGQVRGLALAAALFAGAVLFDSPLLRQAALAGFLFNLAQLAPLRLLDGGRLFPGLDWPASEAPDMTVRLRLSLTFAALVRTIGRRLGLDHADRPEPLRVLLGPALFTVILAGFALVAAVALLLPPKAIAFAILAWVLATFVLILFVPSLDARVMESGSERLLAPRRIAALPDPEPAQSPPGWASREAARAACLAYLLLVLATAAGAYASWLR